MLTMYWVYDHYDMRRCSVLHRVELFVHFVFMVEIIGCISLLMLAGDPIVASMIGMKVGQKQTGHNLQTSANAPISAGLVLFLFLLLDGSTVACMQVYACTHGIVLVCQMSGFASTW